MSNPTPRFTGIFIPAEILEMEELTSTDVMLLSWIDALYCEKHGGCFASNDYFANKLRIKENTVKILISKLVDLGLVERISFDGRTRVIKSCKEKWFKKQKSQSTSDVDSNQPQGLNKINPSPLFKSTPPIYKDYSKEDNKERERGEPLPAHKKEPREEEFKEKPQKLDVALADDGLPQVRLSSMEIDALTKHALESKISIQEAQALVNKTIREYRLECGANNAIHSRPYWKILKFLDTAIERMKNFTNKKPFRSDKVDPNEDKKNTQMDEISSVYDRINKKRSESEKLSDHGDDFTS
jgi:hypothetical protein